MNMTDEQILAAAESCGMMLFGLGMDKSKFEFCILAFAKFVGEIERFKEREACAKVCENSAGIIDAPSAFINGPSNSATRKAQCFADAIRARGQA